MRRHDIRYKILQSIHDTCYVWREEMKQVFRDEGVIIFFILVPLVYPLLYSWIYNNEVVREVPVVVVDDSRSEQSRRFVRMCDASAEVDVVYHAADMAEAKKYVGRHEARGIYYIPSDFASKLNRGEQTVISVYCDMAVMLNYKAVFQTATNVSQTMNAEIQTRLAGNTTDREDEITTAPLAYREVPLFNPAGGYGSFVLPAVLILIIQQTLVLGIGLSAGTSRERHRGNNLIPISRHYHGVMRIVMGKSLCYFMIYAVLSAYLTMVVPRIFDFVTLARFGDLCTILFPYLLACIFFGMTVSCMVRYRENVMLLVVFASVPLLFLTGISWPQSNMPWFWHSISWLFPSTFGVRAYVRLNSMGATLSDVMVEYRALWLQTAFYFSLACLVHRNQLKRTGKSQHSDT